MAVTVGTTAGFVSAAPVADPAGVALQTDTRAHAVKHTAPADATSIIEIGWWCDNATEAANWEGGLYADAGANEPEARLFVTTGNAKGTTSGWKSATVDWDVTGNTVYWAAVFVADTATTTNMDGNAGSNQGRAQKNGVTELPADWGTSSATDTDAAMAIYVVYDTTPAPAAGTDTDDFMSQTRVTKTLVFRTRVRR